MKITGTITGFLPVTEGESQRGHWVRSGLVVKHENGNYVDTIAFSVFGKERVEGLKNYTLGTEVEIEFSISSREYNERWYTDVRASSISPMSHGETSPEKPFYPNTPKTQPLSAELQDEDDLPF